MIGAVVKWLLIGLIVLLPVAVIALGGKRLSGWSGRIPSSELPKHVSGWDRVALNLRPGYDAGAVARHWDAILESKDTGLEAEAAFLRYDLFFPFVYGAALGASLLICWWWLGRPIHPGWLLAPVLAGMVADWIENWVLLGQIRLFMAGEGLQPAWIRLASVATLGKLVILGGTFVLLATLAIRAGCR